MPRISLWSRSLSSVELDQRSREARLRLERIERLLISRATVVHSRFWRLVGFLSVGRDGGAPQRVRPLGNSRLSRMPTILINASAGIVDLYLRGGKSDEIPASIPRYSASYSAGMQPARGAGTDGDSSGLCG